MPAPKYNQLIDGQGRSASDVKSNVYFKTQAID